MPQPTNRPVFLRALACLTIVWSVQNVALVAAQEPLDPQMQAVLDAHASLNPKPLETLSPDEARKQPTLVDAVQAVLKEQGKSIEPESVASVRDKSIKVAEDAPAIPIRIYTPAGEGPFPVLVYWHGGGWVLADLDTYDASCRSLANAAQCIVVSCHYRQAPEHPFPAAVQDAVTAFQWVNAAAVEFNGDPDRIAVAGESAGGNLAAVVVQQAREHGIRLPVHQLLIYPVTDHNFDTESYQEHADARPLNRPMMEWFWNHYLGTGDGGVPTASPLCEVNLTGLPSATIITADVDPLRSEGKAYAEALETAGVDVDYKNYEGVTHEFFGMGAVVDKAKDAMAQAGENLTAAFER